MFLRSLIFVELVEELYKTTPRNFQFSGTGVVAALQPVR